MVALLQAVVDEMVSLDPADLGDASLRAELLALRAQIDRLEGQFARLASAAHQRGIGAADGAESTAAWLGAQAGMREGDARAAIESGETCELLSSTGAAWRAGEITSGAARTIIGARVERHDDQLVTCEPTLLDLARRTRGLRHLRLAAQHFRNLARADGSAPREHDGLHLSRTFEGVTVVSGELSDAGAETVVTALDAYTDPPAEDDPRTASQRRAAALVRACRVALLHAQAAGFATAQVSINLDWTTLTNGELGRADGAFTGPMHHDDIRRILCDCSVSRIVTGPDSLPLDVGRTRRTIPPAIRRAVIARDGGCRFPGCDRPAGWCEIHHIAHWIKGGRTEIGNLAMFCDHHHHVLHQPGWIVKFDGGHDLRIIKPDGTELRSPPPKPGGL